MAIRLYQRYESEQVRMRCAMTPTCSEYAVLAINRHGVLRGAFMTYRRLRYRCNGTPIIDFP
ncbi:MAG: membrane protein insertion efficiency factor YidD [Muribaculaceae bacterium]|nr:membrane protein insertion efficiency factor YidD [Muribaculaceae bacterium]MDE7111376.1 membrane protein insertion efficiency factor YidD [Muribaculaceae bacterium]